MKRTIFVLALMVLVSSFCSLVAYKAGVRRGEEMPRDIAKELPTRVFWNTMFALHDLRAGRIESGTRTVEKVCFASGAIVYSDPASRNFEFTRIFTPEVIQYRATYCTNRAEWTVEEKQLEKLLAEKESPMINIEALKHGVAALERYFLISLAFLAIFGARLWLLIRRRDLWLRFVAVEIAFYTFLKLPARYLNWRRRFAEGRPETRYVAWMLVLCLILSVVSSYFYFHYNDILKEPK